MTLEPLEPPEGPRPARQTFVPTSCWRCRRTAADWLVERTHNLDGRAGCPCGEVIAISFHHAAESPIAPPSSRPDNVPVGWTEQPEPGRWTGFYVPRLGLRLKTVLGFVLYVLVSILRAFAQRTNSGAVFSLLLIPIVIGVVSFRSLRRWRLAMADGVFHASALGSSCRIPLDEIAAFHVETSDKKNEVFTVAIERRSSPRAHLTLYLDRESASYIVERLNDVLAAEGRVGFGYRGRLPPRTPAVSGSARRWFGR